MHKVLRPFGIAQVPARLTTMFLAGVVFQSLLTTGAQADYVYDIANYAPLQNGWTVSGQIVLDTNTGPLASGDFLSWSYTTTNGTQTYTFSSADTPVNQADIFGTVIATPAAIIVPAPTAGGDNTLTLEDGNFPPYPQIGALVYLRDDTGKFGPTRTDNYESVYGPPFDNILWNDLAAPFSLDSASSPDDPWVVATASPEPAALTLLASGVLAFGGFALRRRRATATESKPLRSGR